VEALLERTLVLIKPDGVQRRLIGDIIARFERRGLRLIGMKFIQMSGELAERHYEEHKGKDFYNPLVTYIISGPVVAMVWEGPQVIKVARAMMGPTNPFEAPPGTIRGDFALDTRRNIVHGSDSVESAAREISLFFSPEEIVIWESSTEQDGKAQPMGAN
jgi:nucleoside-diphosphate kinase